MATSTALVDATTLPEPVTRRGLSADQWRTLCKTTYPGADPQSVLLVVDYCRARKLDPFKHPCHIVKMEVKDARTGVAEWRDVVLPGIYEYRTTAHRTGLYLGHSRAVYGPHETYAGVEAPSWCEMTMYRAVANGRAEFPVCVYFRETVATNKTGRANSRWHKAPVQMLTKCTEAAGLREAFPEELGGEPTAEEMDGQRAASSESAPRVTSTTVPDLLKPDGYDGWLVDMQAVADEGTHLFAEAWRNSPPAVRDYLVATDGSAWDALKRRAVDASAARGAQPLIDDAPDQSADAQPV